MHEIFSVVLCLLSSGLGLSLGTTGLSLEKIVLLTSLVSAHVERNRSKA